MMPEWGQKSMTNPWIFRTCDFLLFAKGITLKSFFLHDQGYQKSIKSQSKINANSMLEKGMQKTWKELQNGTKMGAKIQNKSIKNEVRKSMRKKDAIMQRPGGSAGGAGRHF